MSTQVTRINVFQERVFPVLFMLMVTVFFITLVSGIYLATRDNVLSNEQLYLKRAVLFAADIDTPETTSEIERVYTERLREVARYDDGGEQTGVAFYEVLGETGAAIGYVLPASGPGLWGEIEAVVGFDSTLSRMTGVDFIKQNETPGLGGRITESWFRAQFRGKTAPLSRVAEGTKSGIPTEFDAITGATITSTAIENILNTLQRDASGIIEGQRQ